MKVHLQRDIAELDRGIRAMADLVLDHVRRAAHAAAAGDPSAAAELARRDIDVDRQEVRIEEECLKILALYAPVADELRYVFGVTKVNHDLERIGDLAKKVAGQAERLPPGALAASAKDIAHLADMAVHATGRAIDAFITQNAEEARAVWRADAELDELESRLSKRFATELGTPGASVAILLAGRSVVSSLERIGDHAARIAKTVLYMRHGEIVRHRSAPARRVRVLFICARNDARSRIAEAWLRHAHGDRFEVESAGMEPAPADPLAVAVMKEASIDIAGSRPQAVAELAQTGRRYAHAITVCGSACDERCTNYPNIAQHESWSFPDPAEFEGTDAERLVQMRRLRDAIRARVEEWAQHQPAE